MADPDKASENDDKKPEFFAEQPTGPAENERPRGPTTLVESSAHDLWNTSTKLAELPTAPAAAPASDDEFGPQQTHVMPVSRTTQELTQPIGSHPERILRGSQVNAVDLFAATDTDASVSAAAGDPSQRPTEPQPVPFEGATMGQRVAESYVTAVDMPVMAHAPSFGPDSATPQTGEVRPPAQPAPPTTRPEAFRQALYLLASTLPGAGEPEAKLRRFVRGGLALGVAAALVGLGIAYRQTFIAAFPTPLTEAKAPVVAAPSSHDQALMALNDGVMALSKKDVPKAITSFDEALAHDPTLADAHRGLGIAYATSHDSKRAMEHYRTYLQLMPNAQDAPQVRQIIEDAEAQAAQVVPSTPVVPPAPAVDAPQTVHPQKASSKASRPHRRRKRHRSHRRAPQESSRAHGEDASE